MCGYSKNINIGIGMMYSPERINSVNDEDPFLLQLVRSKKIFNKAKELINKQHGEIKWCHYGETLYMCIKCNEFYQRFYFELYSEVGKYEPEYKCWRCKGSLEVLHIEEPCMSPESDHEGAAISKYPCPKCGKYTLTNSGLSNGIIPMIERWD